MLPWLSLCYCKTTEVPLPPSLSNSWLHLHGDVPQGSRGLPGRSPTPGYIARVFAQHWLLRGPMRNPGGAIQEGREMGVLGSQLRHDLPFCNSRRAKRELSGLETIFYIRQNTKCLEP